VALRSVPALSPAARAPAGHPGLPGPG